MTLLDALELHPTSRVALIGGGGKTTLLYQLGREARQRGWPVTLSTTTRMGAPAEDPDLWAEPAEPGKLRGPGLDALRAVTDRLLVLEADGSRGLPLKVHAEHEPVLLPGATVVLVAGMSALGRPVAEAVHRAELLGLSGVVDEAVFLRVVGRIPFQRMVLNQADDPAPARALARRLGGRVVVRGRWGQEVVE